MNERTEEYHNPITALTYESAMLPPGVKGVLGEPEERRLTLLWNGSTTRPRYSITGHADGLYLGDPPRQGSIIFDGMMPRAASELFRAEVAKFGTVTNEKKFRG